ncbi:MAG: GNAT family N-acetyltransferase [Planctomycetota bacterium]
MPANQVHVCHPNDAADPDAMDRYVDIAQESLLGTNLEMWQLYLDRIDRVNGRVVQSENRLVGGLAFYRTGHLFGGREVSAAGVSGVAIDPAHRGANACAKLLESTLQELQREGMPIASLYASTQHLYRGVGFEQAGSRFEYSIPLRCMPRPDRSLECTRFVEPPMDALDAVHRQRALANNGNLVRTEGLWDRLLRPYDHRRCVTYLFGDLNSPAGFAILKQSDRQDGLPAQLEATDWAANSPAALRRLMALLHDHRSMMDRFRWFGGPQDPLLMVSSEQWVQVHDVLRWMIRILNVPSAFEARGYPKGLEGRILIDIQDDLLKSNAGAWCMEWSDGHCRVVRPQESPPSDSPVAVRADIRSLAPLFSGFATAAQLQQLGMLDCQDSEPVALLDAAFAGTSPWLSEIF